MMSLSLSYQSEGASRRGANPPPLSFVLVPGTALRSHSCVALSSAQAAPSIHHKKLMGEQEPAFRFRVDFLFDATMPFRVDFYLTQRGRGDKPESARNFPCDSGNVFRGASLLARRHPSRKRYARILDKRFDSTRIQSACPIMASRSRDVRGRSAASAVEAVWSPARYAAIKRPSSTHNASCNGKISRRR